MHGTVLGTPRLELVACSEALLHADPHPARLAAALGTRVPADWPPDLFDDDARAWTLARVREAPEHEGWWFYYLLRRAEPPERPELVGIAGYKGPPSEDGTVEVGYGVVTAYRRAGYASEATGALIERAFAFPEVRRVIAETYPELVASIGVLQKHGFHFTGAGSEEGVIRYELPRDAWEGRAGQATMPRGDRSRPHDHP
jgi:ribosomal-protein-alanine N-acetyltransferase